MNIRDMRKRGIESKSRIITPEANARFSLTRRQFARGAAGAAMAGAALAAGLRPASAFSGSSAPVPIPGGSPALGGSFHVFGPTPDGSFDPIDAEPATITDFNGFIGLAYADVLVTQTNRATGEVRRLPSFYSDMRFMLGEYRGQDGNLHHGAFALV